MQCMQARRRGGRGRRLPVYDRETSSEREVIDEAKKRSSHGLRHRQDAAGTTASCKIASQNLLTIDAHSRMKRSFSDVGFLQTGISIIFRTSWWTRMRVLRSQRSYTQLRE